MKAVAWALTIVVVCILVSAVLVVIFSTDSPNASMIQWDRLNHRRTDRILETLSPTERLQRLWTQPQPLSVPSASSKHAQHEFQRLGFSDLSRGVVLAAGGPVLTAQARQLVSELRRSGCALPIQLWYRRGEMDAATLQQFETEHRVLACCLETTAPSWPCEQRFSLKPLALYLCPFDRALYLDADVHIPADPSDLLSQLAEGAWFWPDVQTLQREAPCFQGWTDEQKARLPLDQQNSAILVLSPPQCRPQLWTIYRILENGLSPLFPAPYNYGDKDLWVPTWLQQGATWHWVEGRSLEVWDKTGQFVALTHAQPLQPRKVAFVQDLVLHPQYASLRDPSTSLVSPLPADFLPLSQGQKP